MAKSIYPSIPAPGNDMPSIRATLDALRQSMTMVTMNAQNPNPNFAPSSAAQIFVTKDELKASGVVGAQGPTGPQGPPGPGIAEAPNDTNTYGRHAQTWQPVLIATDNAEFVTLPVNAANDAAAATAGVPVGGVYRNGSVLMVRVA
jgi:hypothetical protein